MKTTKEQILQHLKQLKPQLEKEGIEELALFGSFATNEQTVYSDIDIAIRKKSVFFENRTAYDYLNLIEKIKEHIRSVLQRNIDIFDLDSDSDFGEQIQKEMIYV